VQQHTYDVVGNITWVLLQISQRIQQWKNFENRPTLVKVMNECIVAQFFWLTVYIQCQSKNQDTLLVSITSRNI